MLFRSDFILDPLWAQIKPDLFEHIDGLRTVCENPLTGGETFDDSGSKSEMGYENDEDDERCEDAVSAMASTRTAAVPAIVPVAEAVADVPQPAVSEAVAQVPVKPPARRRPARKKAPAAQKPPEKLSVAEPAAAVAPVHPVPAAAPGADSDAKPAISRSASRRRRRSSNKSAAAAAQTTLPGSSEGTETP